MYRGINEYNYSIKFKKKLKSRNVFENRKLIII